MNSRNSRIITPSDRGTMAASRSSTGEGGTTAGWLAATGWVGIDASVDPSWEDGSPVKGGLSVTREMSGFGSTRSVRFVPEGSHAAGGQNGPDHRCDWIASSEEVELR